ncbi:unnamed protein product [Bursaphelenchus xylophilus]|uniref:(pine wood nematode) hypothetical protein n=1 Tax=Bursaphelenchus xylophilus TaxID=6326 RepID=A0A1I7RIK4_BURXY|nr:unnamed protein product [Bursaphelenchus xylophilus]CAG9118844.1 unnamed protein product [Bursaphelenchus xylophilus]
MDTVDRHPAVDHYVRTGDARQSKRPSIFDLMNGQDVLELPKDGKRITRKMSCKVSVVQMDRKEETKQKSRKFGWIEGVFLRCVLNIVGVILYIRLSWITGQAGILLGQLTILLASTVTTITALSLCTICTNGEVKGGGAYFLISRSLGPEFGGPIGIIFSLANCVGAAMYIVGFAETMKDFLRIKDVTFLDGDVNEIRVIGLVACTVLICIVLVGTGFESKLQMILLTIMTASILDYFVGTFIPPSEDQQRKGITGYSFATFSDNLLPEYRDGHSFFSVFSIYFPAATGIMAGANISGDLKRPEKALPLGTLLAIGFTTVLYSIVVLAVGFTVVRDADGLMIPAILNTIVASNDSDWSTFSLSFASRQTPSCSVNNTCEYGTLNYFQILELNSFWGPLITAGIIASSLSSALLSLVSSAKIFQAVCQDRIFPYINKFGQGSERDGEPRKIYILVYIISMLVILIGDLDLIAPIISNFFLGSYVLVNYACFDNSLAQSPGFRPGFKYYNKWVSLAGSILCVTVMFIISWLTALVTFLFFGVIFVYIRKRKPDVNWGSSPQAHCYRNALTGLTKLESMEEHVKNYRPQIMVMTGNPMERTFLVDFVGSITRDKSLMLCANVITKISDDANQYQLLENLNSCYERWLRDRKVKAFMATTINDSIPGGARQLIQTAGLGKMKPNVLLLGFKEDWISEGRKKLDEMKNYFEIIQDAFDAKMGVMILRQNKNNAMDSFYLDQPETEEPVELKTPTILQTMTQSFKSRVKKGTIDVWWLYDDGGLSLLIPHLLTDSKSYLEGAKLRLFTISHESQVTQAQRDMIVLMKKFRLKFKDIIVLSDVGTKLMGTTLHDYNVEIKEFRGEEPGLISQMEWTCHEAKTMKNLRISELLQEHSKSADLVVLSMPVPRKHMSYALYLSWLHQLTKNLPPTVLIRGNQESVLTFYT